MRVSSRSRETAPCTARYLYRKVRRVSEHAQKEQSSVRVVQIRNGQDDQENEETRTGHKRVEIEMGRDE